jgi:hypothetical protein
MARWGAWNKGLAKYPVGADDKRPCVKCGERKPLDEFKKNASCVYGRDTICRACHNALAKVGNAKPEAKAKHALWSQKRKADPAARRVDRDAQLRRYFGIGLLEYEAMLTAQEGKCAICRRAMKLAVDHDHTTGKIRALLCGQCNRALGLLGDDAEIVMRAALYLRTHRGTN